LGHLILDRLGLEQNGRNSRPHGLVQRAPADDWLAIAGVQTAAMCRWTAVSGDTVCIPTAVGILVAAKLLPAMPAFRVPTTEQVPVGVMVVSGRLLAIAG